MFSFLARRGFKPSWPDDPVQPSPGPQMTQTLLPPVMDPGRDFPRCCLLGETRSFCQTFPAKTGISYSLTALCELSHCSWWPPSLPHRWDILLSLQIIVLFSLGCSYSSFQLPGGQGHKAMQSRLCSSTKDTAASSFSHFKRKIKNIKISSVKWM